MESGEKIPWSLLNWPSLVLAVVVSWGILLLPPSYQSKRPQGDGPPPGDSSSIHHHESRFWQDPLAYQQEKAHAESESIPCAGAALRFDMATTHPVVFAVLLPGENYPEDVEARLRSRDSVVSALAAAGYTAEEGGDLRCLRVRDVVLYGRDRLICPYEKFHQPNARQDALVAPAFRPPSLPSPETVLPREVAVVWIDERVLDAVNAGRRPLRVLRRLTTSLTGGNTRVRLAVMGPCSSDCLGALLRDEQSGKSVEGGRKIKIYSFAATVAELRDRRASEGFSSSFDLVHVIGTDVELAKAMRDELKLREIVPAPNTSSIALVAEWDTLYGRTMLQDFSQVFATGQPEGADGIRSYTYLRGLDGRLAREPSAESSVAEKGGTSKTDAAAKEVLTSPANVRAFGKSQVDYLQRLVGRMRADHLPGQPWKAIGVLGSDLYDKMMLIEVLKHEFPGTLLFTTDLDARYLDPDQNHVARNLLVASHYGLELNGQLQGAIPPFRSVYQSALYFACLKAIYEHRQDVRQNWNRTLEISWPLDETSSRSGPPPLVFEVGRSRIHQLTQPGPKELHPEQLRPSWLRTRRWVCFTVLLLAGLGAGWFWLPVLRGLNLQLAGGVLAVVLLALAAKRFGAGQGVVAVALAVFALASASITVPGPHQFARAFLACVVVILVSLSLMRPAGIDFNPAGIEIIGTILASLVLLGFLILAGRKQHAFGAIWLMVLMFLPVSTLALLDPSSPVGETSSLLEGVGNWPTIAIRATAIVFCVVALDSARRDDLRNLVKLTLDYHLRGKVQDVALRPRAGFYRLQETLMKWDPTAWRLPSWFSHARRLSPRSAQRFQLWRDACVGLVSNPWDTLSSGKQKLDPVVLWRRYRRLGHVRSMSLRVLIGTFVYGIFCVLLVGLFGMPNNPCRGPLNRAVNDAALYTAIILVVVLLVSVLDATRQCNSLIRTLIEKPTDWGAAVRRRTAARLGVKSSLLTSEDRPIRHAVEVALEQYTDLGLLSKRTVVVARRVYAAAIAILLMFLARSPILGPYVMSWSMLLIFLVALGMVVYCGSCLRRSAKKARQTAHEMIARVREELYEEAESSPEHRRPGLQPTFRCREVDFSAVRDSGEGFELLHAAGRSMLAVRPTRRKSLSSEFQEAVRALERIERGVDEIRDGAFGKLVEDPFVHTLFAVLAGIGALLSLEPLRMFFQSLG